MATLKCGFHKLRCFLARRSNHARHDREMRDLAERAEPLRLRMVDERCAVEVQAIEEKWRQRTRRSQAVHFEPPTEPLHRPLKRVWRAIGAQRDHFTVEDHVMRSQGLR